MGQAESVGDAFFAMLIWRVLRNSFYRAVGAVKPGWRNALVVVRARDRYADMGTMNLPTFSHLGFEANLRILAAEIRRLRRGGEPRPVALAHDVPPGAKDAFQSLVR